ncbi:MAG TPA: FAD-dependent monooxygenase [Dehalococcoidia bacterium]|nr:FAD-dependent monooxygenase [Dehalococcoidia bacterium]
METEVIVVGAGPVGLTLTLDLARKGMQVCLLEQEPTTKPFPRADRLNARTMECFRRLGLADQIRERGFPPEMPMNIYIVGQLAEPPVVTVECASVAEYRRAIEATNDGTLPLEPYQLVAQNDLEALLLEAIAAFPNVTLLFSHRAVDLSQDLHGVTLVAEGPTGKRVIKGGYLIGCDGAHSTIRRVLGVDMDRPVSLEATLTQVIFRSPDLFQMIPYKGRHYYFLDGHGSSLVVQGNRQEFILHSARSPDSDWPSILRDLTGLRFRFEITHVFTWHPRALVAERYRVGRVFLAGDAAHLVTPWGGLGANSGIGDAFNLAFKLVGALQGWAGPLLLDSYGLERRPIAVHNAWASAWAFEGAVQLRELSATWVASKGRRRRHLRLEMEQAKGDLVRYAGPQDPRLGGKHVGSMLGLELGYSYEGSPVIFSEGGGGEAPDYYVYKPSARPGSRLPHVWLSDGRAMQDVLGEWYTILDLTGCHDTSGLESAFAALGVPVEVLHLEEPRAIEVYESSLLVLRPDLHVVWRGQAPPENPTAIAMAASGHVPAPVSSSLCP